MRRPENIVDISVSIERLGPKGWACVSSKLRNLTSLGLRHSNAHLHPLGRISVRNGPLFDLLLNGSFPSAVLRPGLPKDVSKAVMADLGAPDLGDVFGLSYLSGADFPDHIPLMHAWHQRFLEAFAAGFGQDILPPVVSNLRVSRFVYADDLGQETQHERLQRLAESHALYPLAPDTWRALLVFDR